MEIVLGAAVIVGVCAGLVWASVSVVRGMGKSPKSGSALERRKLQGQWRRDDFEAEKLRRAENAGS